MDMDGLVGRTQSGRNSFSKFKSVYTCIGPSMRPLFRPGDGVRIEPYGGRKIRCGDVVVFRKPGGKQNVVHRVMSVGADGVRTQGDSNPTPDPWVLHPQDILGRVVSRQRRDKHSAVSGGAQARLHCIVLRTLNRGDRTVSRLLQPYYRMLSDTGVFRRVLPSWLAPRVLAFRHPQGQELKMVVGRKIQIGRLLPGESRWRIRRPFRVFIDEADLPPEGTRTAWSGGWRPNEAPQL